MGMKKNGMYMKNMYSGGMQMMGNSKMMGNMMMKNGVRTSRFYDFPVFNRSNMPAQDMGLRTMPTGKIYGFRSYAGFPSPSTNFAYYSNGMGDKIKAQSNRYGRWMVGMLKSTRA